MAPEQAEGKKDVGPACDVYALGAILYECLVGRPPFKGATHTHTIVLLLSRQPVAPRRLNPRVDRDLETITLRCLQKDPDARFATADALADDLRRYLEGRPILSRPVGPAARGWRWARRNPLLAGVSGLALLAVLAVTVLAVLFAVNQHRHAQTQRLHAHELRTLLDQRSCHAAHVQPDERLRWLAPALHTTPRGTVVVIYHGEANASDAQALARALRRVCGLTRVILIRE
jgi:hypothetical protein